MPQLGFEPAVRPCNSCHPLGSTVRPANLVGDRGRHLMPIWCLPAAALAFVPFVKLEVRRKIYERRVLRGGGRVRSKPACDSTCSRPAAPYSSRRQRCGATTRFSYHTVRKHSLHRGATSHREPRSKSSFSSSEPRPTTLMAQTCSDESPARRSPALSSCRSRLTLKAGRGRSGWVGGPIRRLPRITHW